MKRRRVIGGRLRFLAVLSVLPLVGAAACGARDLPSPATGLGGGPGLGMRVYRDPISGAFGAPPAGASAPPRTAAPTAALAETPAPGGGTMVKLGGAFRSQVVAKAGAGDAVVTCAPAARP